MPAQIDVTLPTFTPQAINRDFLYQQFGFLSELVIAFPLLEKPEVLTDIKTEHKSLRSVSCLSDREMWTCREDKYMRLYNLQGKLLDSIETESGKTPKDIAVTKDGGLVYADYDDGSIYLVSDKIKRPLIKLEGWRPLCLCSSSSGDLLITMSSNDKEQTKITRYSGSIVKQSIQSDDRIQPLYSSDGMKYISENRNLDICLADSSACAVVVVSEAGKLRFRYTGSYSTPSKSINLRGITTDSHGKILVADCSKLHHRIHILDQDGKFLRYIDNCSLQIPYGLCVNTRDNLFVAEHKTGEVKKVQYYK